MLFDLDDFKTLNDTLGHDVGDQFLVEVAARMESCIRECDTVARLGGDEFVVILEELDAGLLAAMQAESVAVKIQGALNQPYLLDLSLAAGGGQYAQLPMHVKHRHHPVSRPRGGGRGVAQARRYRDVPGQGGRPQHPALLRSARCRPRSPRAPRWIPICARRSPRASSCCTTSRRSMAAAA
jgi:hypothetical protein